MNSSLTVFVKQIGGQVPGIKDTALANVDSFELQVKKHQGKMYALAYGMLHNREDALEVCQEAFVKAFQALKSFRGEAAFGTWLYRIVVNLCIDFQRKGVTSRRTSWNQNQEEAGLMAMSQPGENPLRALEQKEVKKEVMEALQKLPEEQRACIILREFEGLSYKEIARALNCSQGTVMSRLHYGREKMKELLKPYMRREREL